MSNDKRPEMVRISSFDEMPYDEVLLDAMRIEDQKIDPSPMRDAYRIIQQAIQMDLHRGGVLRSVVVKALLKEAESLLLDSGHAPDEVQLLVARISHFKEIEEVISGLVEVIQKLQVTFLEEDKLAMKAAAGGAWRKLGELRSLVRSWIGHLETALSIRIESLERKE